MKYSIFIEYWDDSEEEISVDCVDEWEAIEVCQDYEMQDDIMIASVYDYKGRYVY